MAGKRNTVSAASTSAGHDGTGGDDVLMALARYVAQGAEPSERAYGAARLALTDALACACYALRYPAATKLLGPYVPGTLVPGGARVPGTAYMLDPVKAAFDFGILIRWLDFNDTWLAAEWTHPSDNLGGILPLADYVSHVRVANGRPPLLMRDVLRALIQAYEIQGTLALTTSLNRAGIDHTLLVAVASAAVATRLLGGDEGDILTALSHAWMDGGPLRAYRHAPETGPRKSWAAGDATSRGVRLALLARTGEMGYPHVLATPGWGFQDARLHGKALTLSQPLDSHVVEHILFKIPYPTEFHGQTAVEAALVLHQHHAARLSGAQSVANVERVIITTQESGQRIIDKSGPLHNPADRDHCIQYMVAYALLHGHLSAEDYGNEAAADPRIDALRAKTAVEMDAEYSRDYLDAAKRSIANAVQVFFTDGTQTERIEIAYPLGHPRRRDEALPVLARKFERGLAEVYSPRQAEAIAAVCADQAALEATPVPEFVDLLVFPPRTLSPAWPL